MSSNNTTTEPREIHSSELAVCLAEIVREADAGGSRFNDALRRASSLLAQNERRQAWQADASPREPTQEELARLVSREVVYCVSQLVYEIRQSALSENLADDVELECARLIDDDWIEAAEEDGAAFCKRRDGSWTAYRKSDPRDRSDWQEGLDDKAEAAREWCEANNCEPEPREVFEHWIVSGWLADQLEAQGETIVRDWIGIGNIWCRTTTGQAIMMDAVIADVWKAARARLHADRASRAA